MDRLDFFGVRPGRDEHTWELPVTPELCSGMRTLFGGATMGAVAEVVERLAGRPPVWLSGQFLSVAHPGDVVELEVRRPATGRRLSQLRVIGRDQQREIVHVAATLGAGSLETPDPPERLAPDVLAPGDCPPRPVLDRFAGTINERIDIRLARRTDDAERPGHLGRGRAGFWARLPELEASPAAMAILGDLVPAGIGTALGAPVVPQSLDNTLRIVRHDPTDWYLIEVQLDGAANGIAHGTATLWSDAGVVLATASQTTVLRPMPAN
ncbi:acyl-CoA thioesterase [Nitriliruptor alkaliphilus]|uniref:acyl-CoA thioesterase n=1 Tax=Nitriliruptor alkaliphilus TaxID=427918 RepID=UPI0006984B4E|nr:thioesterase family protein [Nitriliruptor alkaliphilus]